MEANKNLTEAKKAKKDEFYTQMDTIEKELAHYENQFKGKVIYCNCDSIDSNFVKYFQNNFHKLGIKQLVHTSYPDVDFRSEQSIELLKKCDIVVTNPPFSLFREFVAQMVKYNKKFLIVGNMNATTYKDIFPLISSNKIWYGCSIHSGDTAFNVPDSYELKAAGCGVKNNIKFIRVKGVRWFTNIDYPERHKDLILTKDYKISEYPEYDNYLAINVNKTKDIPRDYVGVMGVPITFLDKYNPEQFEIIKFRKGDDNKDLSVEGRCPYFRILIKRILN